MKTLHCNVNTLHCCASVKGKYNVRKYDRLIDHLLFFSTVKISLFTTLPIPMVIEPWNSIQVYQFFLLIDTVNREQQFQNNCIAKDINCNILFQERYAEELLIPALEPTNP